MGKKAVKAQMLKDFKARVGRSKIDIESGMEPLLYKKGKREWVIRCQKRMRTGNQCRLSVITTGLFCPAHTGRRERQVAALKKKAEKMGIQLGPDNILLKKELAAMEEFPKEQLFDIGEDVKKSSAIINLLLKQKAKNFSNRIEIVKSLQYSLRINAELKKWYYDVKYGSENSVSKEFFNMIMGKINQIVTEEVRNKDDIARIARRMELVAIESREGKLD